MLLWPIPRELPQPNLNVPPPQGHVPGHESFAPVVLGDRPDVLPETLDEEELAEEMIAFGSSEYAKTVLGGVWVAPDAFSAG